MSETKAPPSADEKARPILFSGPMVRSILDGSKAQTRRPMSPQPSRVEPHDELLAPGIPIHVPAGWRWKHTYAADRDDGRDEFARTVAHSGPYGRPGDRLWVRETWATLDARIAPGCRLAFRADTADGERVRVDAPWRPSIHMPRWASRLTLEVTDVRAERLEEIDTEGCIAEGVDWAAPRWPNPKDAPERDEPNVSTPSRYGGNFARDNYMRLWDHINGRGAWDANPWVWVVSFRKCAS